MQREQDQVSPHPGCQYEVFLSFRGPDTRKSFTDCLYNSLKDAGIRVFRDNEELRSGEEIDLRLWHGIQQSKISIPIFSKGYASSKWCLQELSIIARCHRKKKQLVMPIFYDVTPEQVKNQNGSYGAALTKHTEEYPQHIDEWRSALSVLGRLKGLVLNQTEDGHWGVFIKTVVTKVLCELKKAHLPMSRTFVGIDRHVHSVMSSLDVGGGNVRIVGIYGISGIGKTTLAKDVYNKLLNLSDFEGCCFLDNIRDKSLNPNGLERLQHKLVANITRSKHEGFGSVDEGTNVLMDRFHGKKVLILLDDVGHRKQLNALVADQKWFGPGTRIIITTTDGGILRESPQVDSYYEMGQMQRDEALELFSKHAFRDSDPSADPSTAGLMPLAKKIVKATGGLPLALEITGSSLYGRNKDIWNATLKKLEARPEREVLDKLRISYEALEKEEKEIFLDIACFFIGEDKRVAFHMWKDCNLNPLLGTEVLQLRSLIKIGVDNKFLMHNCLRDLGREIVKEEHKAPEMRSRLWCSPEVRKVLQNYKGTENIEAISLQCESPGKPFFCDGKQLKNMSNLRFLRLKYADLTGDIQCLSELRWLSWQKSSLRFPPESLPLEKLKVLDMSGSEVDEDWSAWSSAKTPVKLKVLDLSGCYNLMRTPDLSMFRKLDRLTLQDCLNLSGFHPSLVFLQSLTSLNLTGCWNVSELPHQLGSLRKLAELIIDGTSIIRLPDSVGSLKNLQRLSANDCQNLKEIPDTIGWLILLTELSLSGTAVETLPRSVGNLINMEVLNISSSSLSNFPSALGRLWKLKEINASKCKNLEGDIPPELELLSSLKILKLDGTNISHIPDIISRLSHLQTLHLTKCLKLQSLPDLPVSLISLMVTCPSLEAIPNLADLMNLEELVLSINTPQHKISSLLHEHPTSRCIEPPCIPDLPERLHKLNISNSSFQILPALSNLQQLSELSIESCSKLTHISGLGFLFALKRLKVDSCHQLFSLSGLESLNSLRVLHVCSCEKLIRLPNLSRLTKLLVINTRGCESLVDIEGLDSLYALTSLDIGQCKSIRKLPDISNLKSLQSLSADGCWKLEGLEGLGKLQELSSLRISSCREIRHLPDLLNLQKLRHLDITGCEDILEVRGLIELKSLERVVVCGNVRPFKLIEMLKDGDVNSAGCDDASAPDHPCAWPQSHLRFCSQPAKGPRAQHNRALAVSINEGRVVGAYQYNFRRATVTVGSAVNSRLTPLDRKRMQASRVTEQPEISDSM